MALAAAQREMKELERQTQAAHRMIWAALQTLGDDKTALVAREKKAQTLKPFQDPAKKRQTPLWDLWMQRKRKKQMQIAAGVA